MDGKICARDQGIKATAASVHERGWLGVCGILYLWVSAHQEAGLLNLFPQCFRDQLVDRPIIILQKKKEKKGKGSKKERKKLSAVQTESETPANAPR